MLDAQYIGPSEVGMASAVTVLIVAVDRTAARAEAAYVGRLPGFRTAATVGSAAAGMRRLAKGDVDLVLMDQWLPDGDGAELAARLCELGFRADVILTRAAGDPVQTANRVTPPGVVGELIRPFTFDGFRETLLAWVATRALAADPGENTERAEDGAAARTGRAPGRRLRGGRSGLPLGMRPDTLDAITVVLSERSSVPAGSGITEPSGEAVGLSVSCVATAVGASRLTVRRYLEYLADAGVLARSLRRRATGRPEALYRLVAQSI